eukprot:TRINITY_DN34246_c0_g1_i1.p1 TRINITY_DN34246_c0_g1~~TRINITY_DN34246_c0_g1_i1.p1  ORF type:complete len:400 (+),score=119.75 TRINITY_DN34246_c0_g1_i1:80-1279(+)
MFRAALFAASAMLAMGSREISHVTTNSNAKRLAVLDGVAYVADTDYGLTVANYQQVLGGLAISGMVKGVDVKGTTAFVVGVDGLMSVDVSNSSDPTLLDTYTFSATGETVTISGKYAYIASNADGLIIVDISDVSNMKYVAQYLPTNLPRFKAVQILGDYAYIADYNNGLVIVNVATPSSPLYISLYRMSGAYDVAVSGTTCYVASYSTGMTIIDVTNKAVPVKLSTYSTSDSILAIEYNAGADQVYLAGNNVYFIDVSDAGSPWLVSKYMTTDYRAYDVAYENDKLYVAGFSAGLYVLQSAATLVPDTAAPTTPSPPSSDDDDDLSPTAVAAIVVGCVAFVGIIGAIVVIFVVKPQPAEAEGEAKDDEEPVVEADLEDKAEPQPVADEKPTSEMEPDV